ncbi:uncharacterized protein LOC130811314 [Amaranthus tricolor]|uniref:uncharacterized protein LOC130811314 n=1 Tax=Amaranthus tricolor TaxID=29722 RepID=UPI00258DC75B|nr:uncharacterized protein LOC130811314 [Amaranthus tricolor]XP_057533555.1 uncharacterized protein LOC130811314 [Amaranthus tricolor]XP_057533556.1 uncharacterized protein LOC130811314 [Amaranthus tricolor]
MAKKSRKRVARYQRDQSGCMWSLISMFDYRHGRSSQKMLPDRKRGSKRLDGPAYANIKLESLTDSCEICNDISGSVQLETSASDNAKLSVKELMEEEMLGEQDQKRQESIANGETKLNTSSEGGHIKRNRRWMKNKMSLDLDANGFVAADQLIGGKPPSHRKHKSCSSVDLNVIVEELCSRIHPKDTSCLEYARGVEHAQKPVEDPSVLENKLWEATKILVNHFTNENGCSKDGKIQPSKELVDALQVLNSNKEFFLKLLQDPHSQLVKHIQSSQDIQVEEGKFKVLTGPDVSGQDIGNAKQHNYFWRRFKGVERNSSKRTNSCEDISKIVVLRPGPPNAGNSDTGTPCNSLPDSLKTTGDKGQTERTVSPFSFTEFKKKLIHAMRKENHGLSDRQSTNREKKIGGETMGMASPSRDHFFIEKVPKALVGNKVDKTGKLKDEGVLTPEQRVSNIYIEAKKHLAEIVGNTDIDGNNPGKRRPRSLGRILAYSGYNSPICSPRTKGELRLPLNEESQTGVKKAFQVVQVKQDSENEPFVAANKHEVESRVGEPSITDELLHGINIGKPIQGDAIPTSEDSLRSAHVESRQANELTEISSKPNLSLFFTDSDQVDCSSTCSDENLNQTSLKEDICEENEPSSSSNASTLICKVNGNGEDLDTASDATSKPSPISVLDPVFQDDDISPPGKKYSNDIQPIQPRQIRFGEEISETLEKVPSYRICATDEKYTVEFVKDVVQMSGLTWDELLRRSLFEEHLVYPSLVDEIDFLPDLLTCDFNALFDLITEVLIEICRLNFGCMLSLATPYIQPELKGKDLFTELWKGVDWYLKLEAPSRTLDQIIAKDLEKTENWIDVQLDCQSIGIQMQEAILEDIVEEAILSFFVAEAKESVVNVDV